MCNFYNIIFIFKLFIHIILCRRKEIPAAVGVFISPITVQKTELGQLETSWLIGGDLQSDSSLVSSHAGVASWRSKIVATRRCCGLTNDDDEDGLE
jgi:hypothetical protein